VPEQRLLVGVCVSGESDVGVSDPGSGPRARRLQISGPVCSNCEIVFPGVQKSKGPASIQYYYVVIVRSCVRYLHCTRVLVTRDPSLGLGVKLGGVGARPRMRKITRRRARARASLRSCAPAASMFALQSVDGHRHASPVASASRQRFPPWPASRSCRRDAK